MNVHFITRFLWLFFLHIVSLNMIILELMVCGQCWCKLVHPVPMLTVDWSCHSLLLVELFIDSYTFFPRVMFGLAALVWVIGLGFLLLTCSHVATNKLSYKQQGRQHIYINFLNFFFRTDLLLLTPSVGNSSCPNKDLSISLILSQSQSRVTVPLRNCEKTTIDIL